MLRFPVDDDEAAVLLECMFSADDHVWTLPTHEARLEYVKEFATMVFEDLEAEDARKVLATYDAAPKVLRHTLDVVCLWQEGIYTRVEATHKVAKHQGLYFTTVQAAYSTQLGIKVGQFDRLIAEPGLGHLRALLIRMFPEYSDLIAQRLA